MRARTVCAVHGCPEPAVKRGRCDRHVRRVNGYQWRRLVHAVVERDGGVCWLCGKGGADTADHVRRVRDGGDDDLRNLRAAHVLCNMSRG